MDTFDVTFYYLSEKLYSAAVKAKDRFKALDKVGKMMESSIGITEFDDVKVKYIPKHLL